MPMGRMYSGHALKAIFQVAEVRLVVTTAASPSGDPRHQSDRSAESFTATRTKFERRISGQKRDGRLITRLSPL